MDLCLSHLRALFTVILGSAAVSTPDRESQSLLPKGRKSAPSSRDDSRGQPVTNYGGDSSRPLSGEFNQPEPAHHTSLFSGGSQYVAGGYFTINNNVGGRSNLGIDIDSSAVLGIRWLSQATAQDAMHDSSARYPPPKCHPDTRLGVIHHFLQWIYSAESSPSVYWLHAPFGHGKSAVMQTVIDRCTEDERRDLVAGSFFFARHIEKTGYVDARGQDPLRDRIQSFLPTIAYQIALNIPGIREHINSAMVADPSLPSKSLEIQLRQLIIEPLLKCEDGGHLRHTPTVFIDGLDECESVDSQLDVLNLISTAILLHQAPLRFIVASRPEAHIRDSFDQAPLKELTGKIELPDDDAEMTTFLDARFDRIYDRHARIMVAEGVKKPWPPPEQIRDLVWRACGQYVFLQTIIRFIETHRRNPVQQLDIVLNRLSDPSVFSDMDTIYHLILDQCPVVYQHVLSIVLYCLRHAQLTYKATVSAIAETWRFSRGDVRLVVDSLAAVVEENEGNGELAFHHLSFREFLESKGRCGRHFTHHDIVVATWNHGVRDAFKRVLCGNQILRDPIMFEFFGTIFNYHGEGQYRWTTSTELQGLLRRGQDRFQWGTCEFSQWYRVVELLRSALERFPWLQSRMNRAKWMDDQIDSPFTAELHKQCLDVWRVIFQKAFAELSPKLAGALLILEQSGGMVVRELAKSIGMPTNRCLSELNKIGMVLMVVNKDKGVVNAHRRTEVVWNDESVVGMRGDDYIHYDRDGNQKPIGTIRRAFYSIS